MSSRADDGTSGRRISVQKQESSPLQELIPALVTAWKNLSVYPAGHPAREAGVRGAHKRLTGFMAAAGPLTLGVAKDGLTYGDRKLESPHVVALAQALFRRNAATVRFEEGVAASELEAFLKALGDSKTQGTPRPLAEELAAAGAAHVVVTTLDYSLLKTTDDVRADRREPANLWEAILDALLTGKQLDAEGAEPLAAETYSAKGIASLFAPSDSDRQSGRLGGVPVQLVADAVAAHLSRTTGAARDAAVHEVAELVRALPTEVRERVLNSALKVLAAEESAAEGLLQLTSAVSADEVLVALRRLSAEGMKLSSHALRLVQTLAAAASRAIAERSASGNKDTAELAAELGSLFRDEDIDRYNPEDHDALIDQAAAVDLTTLGPIEQADLPDLGDRAASLTDAALERTLLATLLDLLGGADAAALPDIHARLEDQFVRALSAGRFDRAIEVVDGIKAHAADTRLEVERRKSLEDFLVRLAGSQQVMGMIGGIGALPPPAVAQLKDLIARLGAAAARSLLNALIAAADQTRRRRLFNILSSLGAAIVPEAQKLLRDSRWFVVRNMIALLRAVGDKTSLPEIRRCAENPDLRVRLEAIKTLLAFDPSVPKDLLETAILDKDPKLAEAAVVLTGQYGIQEAKQPLVAILRGWDPFGARRSLRLKALRALADLGDPAVLPSIDRFFKNWRLPLVALEERRTAFKLLEAFPEEARRPFVDQGLRSSDKLIQETCRRLSKTTAQAARPAAAASGFDQRPAGDAS
jgi:hypothetical protein